MGEGDAAAAVAAEIEVAQYAVGVGDTGTVAATGILCQLNGGAPAGGYRRKAGDIHSRLHGGRYGIVPQGKCGIAGGIHTGIEGAGSPGAVIIRASIFADEIPDDGLCRRPFLGIDDIAAVPVAGGGTVLRAGIAAGQCQRDAALDGGGQVIPAAAGALHIVAAVVGADARLDAVGHGAVDVFHVVQGAAAAETAVCQNGQVSYVGCGAGAVIILGKGQLVGVDIDLVLDHHDGGIGGYRQRRRHDQRQRKGCKSFECFQ